ncbi:Protein RNH-1.0 c [Aphelenchoides avenae]|nr:Protein RNH-1.0 c [Aphelenchus avenae]
MNSVLSSSIRLGTRTAWKFCQQHPLHAGPPWVAWARFCTHPSSPPVVYITAKTDASKTPVKVRRPRVKTENCSPPPTVSDKPPAKKRVKTESVSPPPLASDNPNAPVVYTDGSCLMNGKGGAKAGYGVFWGDGHPDNVGAPVNGNATNNRGEFLGAIIAIRQAVNRGFKLLTLCTDSQLLINSATHWMPRWKRRGWKKSDGSPVLNVDLLQALDVLMSKIQVTWKYVPKQANIHGNKMADQLAREGAKKYDEASAPDDRSCN